MTQIELSQEELDLIQAKREEEAAREKVKQDRIAADIVKAKASIARRLEESEKQRAAALAFQKELGKGWTAHTESQKSTEKVYWGGEVGWEETYAWDNVSLKYGEYKVAVYVHTVYGSSWGRGTNKGYKMFLSGPGIEYGYSQKALSKAATVNKKVQERIQIAKDVEERKKSKQTAVETAVHDLQVAYPTAKVTASKDWTRGYGKSAYRDYDKITIQFTNGIQVAYEVYSDGRLNRLSVDFGKLEHHEVLNLLSEAQAPISE